MTTTHADASIPQNMPILRSPKPRQPILSYALPATALGSGVLLGLAIPSIINATGYADYAKAGVLAFSATAVSFAVNKTALERGAPLGTTGYHGATIVSIISVLTVGAGLFGATYSGLTLKDTAELQLQEHGQALGIYVSECSEAAAEAARVLPAIRAVDQELSEKAACEIATSCISGRGSGGNGPVARAVGELAGRASSIGRQIETGVAARQEITGRLAAAIAEYQTILGEEKDVWERRARLQVVDARIRQSIGDLNEAVPLSLIAAYAQELQSGAQLAAGSEADVRLNDILSRHAQSLVAVVGSIDDSQATPPQFPKRTGVSDTFRYIHHFLPVAAIAAVVELVFPIVLFACTYWELAWSKYIRLHRAGEAARSDEDRDPQASVLASPKLNGAGPPPAKRGRPRRAARHLDT